MNTNIPMFGPVVLEIACSIFTNKTSSFHLNIYSWYEDHLESYNVIIVPWKPLWNVMRSLHKVSNFLKHLLCLLLNV